MLLRDSLYKETPTYMYIVHNYYYSLVQCVCTVLYKHAIPPSLCLQYGPDGLKSPLMPTHTLPADQLALRRVRLSDLLTNQTSERNSFSPFPTFSPPLPISPPPPPPPPQSTVSVSPKTSPGIQRKDQFGYSLQVPVLLLPSPLPPPPPSLLHVL